MSFNSFSQIDIKNEPTVILTEKQAKEVVKDLIRLDSYIEINSLQEDYINTLLKKEIEYKTIIELKKENIVNLEEIVKSYEKILNSKKLEFHSYAGVQTFNIDISNPSFYVRSVLEFQKINLGVNLNFQPVSSELNYDGFNYNIFVEYKIF